MKTARLLSIVISLCLVQQLSAQDIHFSQIGNSPLNLNPALTGVFEGDARFVANYRSQWRTIAPYETVSGAFDMSFYNDEYQKRFFSAGLLFNYDVAGDLGLTFATLGVTGSYTHRVDDGHYLSVGGMIGYNNRSFAAADGQFLNQYGTESPGFDPSLSSGESFVGSPSVNLWDLSAGFNWHYRVPKRSRRTAFDLGIGIMHFNQPEEVFQDGSDLEQLPLRWSPHFMGTFQFHDKLDLLAQATFQQQNTHRQFMYGAGLQVHVDTDPDEELAVQLSVNRRAKDAWTPVVGLRYRMWQAAFSYDLNTSDLRIGTDRRGGPELSLRYILTRVKPMEAKICPPFL